MIVGNKSDWLDVAAVHYVAMTKHTPQGGPMYLLKVSI